MRFQLATILAVALATLSSAKPTWQAEESRAKSSGGHQAPNHTSPRPSISCFPKTPHIPPPWTPPRNKVCYVKSHNDSVTDDSTYILDALHDCNNGGHVVFTQGVKYTIGTALDLTFLNHIDIGAYAFTSNFNRC
jgi:galacturan 1,4-alpha-galacturonidase